MKKASRKNCTDMEPEYNFSGDVRGKYAKRFAEGTNVVVLEPDVLKVFPDSASVNHALRLFVEVAKRTGRA